MSGLKVKRKQVNLGKRTPSKRDRRDAEWNEIMEPLRRRVAQSVEAGDTGQCAVCVQSVASWRREEQSHGGRHGEG